MATQTETPRPAPSAQDVANLFVKQYYSILHHDLENVVRFYNDTSVMGRPDSSGLMTFVTSLKDINDKICSFYKNYKAEFETFDAQDSHNEGVFVLVTGYLTGKDNVRKIFAQTIFLARQGVGYYVLNDILRYVKESKDVPDEVEGHSIHIRNLPRNANVAELEAEFKKFGPIKENGVQVRSNKQKGFCYGFVEYQDFSSMQNAIKASPVTIRDHQAAVEIKKTTTRVGSGRGRFTSARGDFSNDNFRGR